MAPEGKVKPMIETFKMDDIDATVREMDGNTRFKVVVKYK